MNADWEKIYSAGCPLTAYQYLELILKQVLDKHAQFITKRVKGKPSPWIKNDLKNHMNNRDQLKRRAKNSGKTADWRAYTRKRNFAKNEISRAKRSHLQNELRENAKKPDRFWKVIKEVFPVKSKSNNLSFNINVKSTTDKASISRGFCSYFSTIAQPN